MAIGSFLNCLIWRLHKKEGLLNRSYCPRCRHKISWYDNIPILSFIILLGRCRHCGKKISWQYPMVEIITGLLFLVAFILEANKFSITSSLNFQFSIFNFQSIYNLQFLISKLLTFNFLLLTLKSWFIISVMIVIFIYDLRWYLILDIITLPAGAVVFVLNLFLGFNWLNLLVCGIIGGSFFLVQFLISKGKWIGGGDIRLGMLMGLCFGNISWLILSIMLAYFIGSIVGLGLIVSGKKKWGSEVPLGVFLAATAIITLFFGQEIIDWYFQIIRIV